VLSLVFALLFTALGTFELYVPSLTPRMGEPVPVTLRVPYGPLLVAEQPGGHGPELLFEHARVVIPRGTVLGETDVEQRAAFAYESTRRPPSLARLASTYVIHFIVCMMLTAYLRRFGQSRVRLLRAQAGLLVLMAGSIALAKALLLFTALPEFWIPIAALPLWVALAFDRRTAFLLEVGVAFVAASLLRFDLVLFAVLLVRGIAATLFFFNKKHPRQMLVAGTLSGISGVVAYAALTVIFEGRFDVAADLARGLGSNSLACFGGGLLAGLVARSLREPAERIMGHVPRDRLLDLTDLEQPLLKKMAAEAPGSWEHARAMANLAEAAAAAIQADALLVRVGAYYHDLGKTVQPRYFIENLTHGDKSPHAALEPDVSADAIMAHVVMGTKILREANIPEPVVEFAYTHHGTQLVEYFWHKCQESGNPKHLGPEHFRYPGMKPQTKETAILMLVDSIEAASRTISPPEHDKFEEMIRRVVFSKLASGQLDESGLSLEDLRILITRMASTLVNMYHGRVKYPWQRDAGDRSTQTPPPVAAVGPASMRPTSTPLPAPPKPAGAPVDETPAAGPTTSRSPIASGDGPARPEDDGAPGSGPRAVRAQEASAPKATDPVAAPPARDA
jgi:hypothetical protein